MKKVKQKFYAVWYGKKIGIYAYWECKNGIDKETGKFVPIEAQAKPNTFESEKKYYGFEKRKTYLEAHNLLKSKLLEKGIKIDEIEFYCPPDFKDYFNNEGW